MLKNLLINTNKKLLQRLVVQMDNLCKFSTETKEQQINISGQCINYLKVGSGNHALLCFPGALGTIWSDFEPQIEQLDKNKFTIIAWDPPGYGKSRPPNRNFNKHFYEEDADKAHEFMNALGLKQYSLLGWSDGGIASIFLSAKYPDSVHKLVIWGANAYVIGEEIQSYEKIRDISNWSDKMKAPLIKLYGKDGLQNMWNDWCNALQIIYKEGGDICKHKLEAVQCPTLILHGDKDPMIAREHPKYLTDHIKGAKLHRFPEGKHNIHLRYAQDFNAIVTKFLEESAKI